MPLTKRFRGTALSVTYRRVGRVSYRDWSQAARRGQWSDEDGAMSLNPSTQYATDFNLPLLTVRTDDGYDPPLAQVVDWVINQTRER